MAAVDTIQSNAEEPISEKVHAQGETLYSRKSTGKRILGLLWDSLDEKSPEEHRLVRRLDSCYLIWACFYYFVMYLDSSMWRTFRKSITLLTQDFSSQHLQCICQWDERGSQHVRESTELPDNILDDRYSQAIAPGCTVKSILIATPF